MAGGGRANPTIQSAHDMNPQRNDNTPTGSSGPLRKLLRRMSCAAALWAAGCGGMSQEDAAKSFHTFADSMWLRLQNQYYDAVTAPADLEVKMTGRPATRVERAGDRDPWRGILSFEQQELMRHIERDQTFTLTFVRRANRWELVSATAKTTLQRRRGPARTEEPTREPMDALQDEIYGPRIRAAYAATPQGQPPP
jgi:hypothetical protein